MGPARLHRWIGALALSDLAARMRGHPPGQGDRVLSRRRPADAYARFLARCLGDQPGPPLAGIHFMKVLRSLGLDEQLQDRMRTFPNGPPR